MLISMDGNLPKLHRLFSCPLIAYDYLPVLGPSPLYNATIKVYLI